MCELFLLTTVEFILYDANTNANILQYVLHQGINTNRIIIVDFFGTEILTIVDILSTEKVPTLFL